MRAWQFVSFSGLLGLTFLACGGESSTAGLGMTATGSGGSGGGSAGAVGTAGDSSGVAGSSNGGNGGSSVTGAGGGQAGAEAMDASSGSGGAAKDASVITDASVTVRDAARTAPDGACTEGTTDRCDTCTDARCCMEVDACEANAACKAAFAKIDACIGDASTLARVRNCYNTFQQTNGTNGTARNLAQCVQNRCTNQCRL